jgi:hypothetical protein
MYCNIYIYKFSGKRNSFIYLNIGGLQDFASGRVGSMGGFKVGVGMGAGHAE